MSCSVRVWALKSCVLQDDEAEECETAFKRLKKAKEILSDDEKSGESPIPHLCILARAPKRTLCPKAPARSAPACVRPPKMH